MGVSHKLNAATEDDAIMDSGARAGSAACMPTHKVNSYADLACGYWCVTDLAPT